MKDVLISHEVRPLDRVWAISHFSANVGREDFKEPSIRVLVCHGPDGGVISSILFFFCVRECDWPVKVEHDELFLGRGHR